MPKRALSGYEDGGAAAPAKLPQPQAMPQATSMYRNPTFAEQGPGVSAVGEGSSVPHSQPAASSVGGASSGATGEQEQCDAGEKQAHANGGSMSEPH